MACPEGLRPPALGNSLKSMTPQIVKRWLPDSSLTERPLSIFDLQWYGGDLRLITSIHYSKEAGEPGDDSAVLVFDGVTAFQVFDEYWGPQEVLESSAAQLAGPYPYGGRWPFLELDGSRWITALVARERTRDVSELRHLVVTSQNMDLHVAIHSAAIPMYYAPKQR